VIARASLSLLGGLSALGIALTSPAAGAVTVGQTFDPGTSSCGNFLLQSVSPSNAYAAPFDGVLTQWSYEASEETGQLRLKVGRSAGTNSFFVVGQSAVKSAVADRVNTFPTRISVKALDVIGMTPVTTGIPCIRGMATGYSYSAYVAGADLPPGQTGTFNPPVPNVQIDVSAVLEADSDGDGFGDESQDQCLGISGPDRGCLADPPQTSITKDVKRSRTGKATFRFASDEPHSTFKCKLKGKGLKRKLREFRLCASPRKYKNLDEGRYRFKVRAIDEAGNVDPTPAKDQFRVLD
jgi:hypothetical protein